MRFDARLGGGDGPPIPDGSAEVLRVLSHPHRSTAVSILRDHDGRVETTDLATRIAARVAETPLVDVSRAQHDPLLVSLRHHHLPKLEEHDLVDWDRTAGTVALASEPPIPDDRLRTLVEVGPTGSGTLASVLSSDRRRTALAALADGGATTIADLARRVAARETGSDPADVADSEARRVRTSLCHAHVPAMDAAGVVEYDEEEGTVSPCELPPIPSR